MIFDSSLIRSNRIHPSIDQSWVRTVSRGYSSRQRPNLGIFLGFQSHIAGSRSFRQHRSIVGSKQDNLRIISFIIFIVVVAAAVLSAAVARTVRRFFPKQIPVPRHHRGLKQRHRSVPHTRIRIHTMRLDSIILSDALSDPLIIFDFDRNQT